MVYPKVTEIHDADKHLRAAFRSQDARTRPKPPSQEQVRETLRSQGYLI